MTAKKKAARSNGHVQVVPIVFEDGRARTLRLDFNALSIIEDLTGINVLQDGALSGNLSIKKVTAIVYALLKHEDADLTIEQVGKWLHPGNIGSSMTKLTEALNAGQEVPKANG